ncbi:MAG: PTS lactose transporter subunit IIBC [Candidatus Fimousia sp.]|uniref:PTS lactose transporter subunit IIBC n=1 Tax=Anaerostipes sp. 992a TaxID=1261637 RepID=UPI00095353CC|nr:PTS lactose transporter subunit IIBC [Anaerostipes sp. 992a]MDD5967959.1 PTS lactose transporter subunit IIBC [Anaerostipes sp.]OLR64029.1 PTS lactose transporter subunit IIBC [Anaerostipes sp. 992a]
MKKLIKAIEKLRPYFDVIARNRYLKAIKDGFISAMPIVLFSSIFMLLAYVPNIFGFYWSKATEAILLKPYNYSMGILGLVVAGTTAKHLADSFNRDMPVDNQINNISALMAGMVSFLVLGVDSIEGGFSSGYMGSKGLLTAFVVAFMVGNVYKFCIKRNITIRMPDAVPPNISQTFKDVIPFAVCVIIATVADVLFRKYIGVCFAQFVIEAFQPLFAAADGYVGLAIIYGAMAMFWFVGIQGPAIVEPAVAAIYYVNIANNLELYQAGEHAYNILTPGVQQFVATLGGTGATLVITFMFAFMAKSKELKAIGRASSVPVLFGVNEPILFGAPLILNPVFFVPFIFAPIINVWIFKFFVDFIGMNSFLYVLPWTTPGPIGLILGCGIGLKVILLAILLLVVDFVIYYPFFKVYDHEKMEEEKEKNQDAVEEEEKQIEIDSNTLKSKRILVLCAGGGTSGLLANALKKAAQEKDIPLISAAGAYGAHMDIMKDYDLVVLAPQVASFYGDLKKDADRMGIKCVACEGKQYISLTRNPEEALNFVFKVLEEKE